MTPLALVFMLTGVFSVTALAAWCFYRVLWLQRHPPPGQAGDADQR